MAKRKIYRIPDPPRVPQRLLMRYIRAHVQAEIAHSWMGGADPASHAEIRAQRTLARVQLQAILHQMYNPT